MRRTERVVAALIFAVALAGGALIPRLLSVPALSLGVPLGLGPSRVGVQVLAIPRARRQATHPQGAPPSAKVAPAASAAPVAPVVAQPAASAVPASKPRQHRPPSPPPPPPPPPPPALVRQVTASEASSSTLTVPVEGGTTTGDGLVAAIALKAGSSASVNSVQDSSGGSWVSRRRRLPHRLQQSHRALVPPCSARRDERYDYALPREICQRRSDRMVWARHHGGHRRRRVRRIGGLSLYAADHDRRRG